MRPSEYSLFQLRVTLSGHDVNTYKLSLYIYKEKSSKRNLKSNYNYNKTEFLAFDKKNKAYYSNYETIIGYYKFHNLNANVSSKKYIKSDIPVVNIEKDKYYYIKGNW